MRSATTHKPQRRRLAVCSLTAAIAFSALPANAQSSVPLPLLPNGIAYDATGNLYFADTNRHQVYESSLAGVLTVVAGSGVQGFAGDGGPATNAQLSSPQGVAVGPDGTLYIADTGNHRIRAVFAGQITTLAGNGLPGFEGDGGSASAALLNTPTALTVDSSGALLVCDAANQRIRRIANGNIVTVAGNGVQGFAGDGAAATAAQLDTPSGVAVGLDGRIYIADAHNERIRVIGTNGTIGTFAGSGVRGYAGDGAAATAAELSFPRGIVLTSTGAVLFADSNNQRLRSVDTNGVISTVAGSGVQGNSSDGNAAVSAGLDTPRGVAVSTFGSAVFADANNHQVREDLLGGNLYVPAGLAPLRVSIVSLNADASGTYDKENATVSVQGAAGTAQGTVQLLDGATIAAQQTLASGAATFVPGSLRTGTYALSATYSGDGVNPAATSSIETVDVGAAVVLATANAATVEYGEAIPALAGSITGILPQDSGNVGVVFTTTAAALASPGIYSIGAMLTGPGSENYRVVLSPASGSLTIIQATSLTAEQPLAQSSYTGLPLALTADVSSTTRGTPTGAVTFTDGTTVVGTATLIAGVASATYLSPSAGTHSIVAMYAGDRNFLGSSSQAVTTTVGAMPDFTITSSGVSTQTISAGGIATYTMNVTAQPGPFTGVVDLSVSGLPAQAVATFSPPQTVPGAGAATITMQVQTTAVTSRLRRSTDDHLVLKAVMLLPFVVLLKLQRSRIKAMTVCLLVFGLLGMSGCGARSISTAVLAQQRFDLQVTGTSTNLAGAIVTHTASVTLVMQ